MKGYAYIEKDRVVVNREKKPDEKNFSFDGCRYLKPRYMIALSEWEDSCYEVENDIAFIPDEIQSPDPRIIRTGHWQILVNDEVDQINPGQPVDFTLSGTKAVINKID